VRSFCVSSPAGDSVGYGPSSMQAIVAAAAVHVFTGLGIVCALMCARATISLNFEAAFFWLGIAFFIDGVDGMFARKARVKEVLPSFSGETLDLVIDYITYVFLPALMLLQAGFLTGWFGILLASLICLSSLYHFSDEGSKAEDNCFVGFPAIWNIVAFYIFAFALPAPATTAIILVCVALTFVPLKWVHPMRVVALRPLNLLACLAWAAAATVAVYDKFPAGDWPKLTLVGVGLYGIGLTVWFGQDKNRRKVV
jgi:phosphatidylcholine synthase